jgi:Domain of unknown function (DUF397)
MVPDLEGAAWRKSGRSAGNGGNCVEVAVVAGFGVVRDSKNVDGPVLAFGRHELAGLLRMVKAGRFGR